MDGRTKCNPNKFAEDTKPGRLVDAPGSDTIEKKTWWDGEMDRKEFHKVLCYALLVDHGRCSLLSTQPSWDTSEEVGSVLGSAVQERHRCIGTSVAAKIVKELGNLAYKEGLEELGLFVLGKKGLGGILDMFINILLRRAKKSEPDSSQCPLTGQEETN